MLQYFLNVTICKDSGHAQHDFEPLEKGHWIFSGYKVNVMFILSESCSPGLSKTENIFMVCQQTADHELKRETGRLLHTKGAAIGEGLVMHYLRVHFYSC